VGVFGVVVFEGGVAFGCSLSFDLAGEFCVGSVLALSIDSDCDSLELVSELSASTSILGSASLEADGGALSVFSLEGAFVAGLLLGTDDTVVSGVDTFTSSTTFALS
jgi:hypothetical protein